MSADTAPVVFKAVRHRPSSEPVLGQIILKIAQRCNLNCTYCYVYNRGDESWRTRPVVISEGVLRQLGSRITEHCERYGLSSFTIELHGGEPLLVGKKRMQALVDILRDTCSCHLHFTMQTNGLLLDGEWLELLARNEISFGISLDGPPAVADEYRVMRKDGSGSTQPLLDIIADLRGDGPTFDELFGGCLCVVNPALDGGELVDWFVEQGFPSFDFLLPDGNRVNPPQGWTGVEPYTRFLLAAFERWYSLGDRAPRIRKFELMMTGLMGGNVFLDALGGDLRLLCVVESDGSIGVSDVTRICGGEYSQDALNVFDNPLDAHISRYRIMEIQEPCATCQQCPHLASCGGGYLPHRFDGLTFDNPSLYCDALFALSARMMQVLRADLPAELWTSTQDAGLTGALTP
jgi:uncharacterized protein